VATTETDRFAAFFGLLGHSLEPFQRAIVEEIFSDRRETLVLIPRGNGKSTLLAAVALWCLLRKPDACIVVGAASRDQAAILFDIARGFAQHQEIARLVQTTRREIRTAGGWLKVIAADGPKQHGLIVDMAIVDELHAHARRDLYDALRTAMLKRPGARMVTISTAGATVDTPLGELYERARKLPDVSTDGPLTRATGPHLAMLEWRAEDPDDIRQVLAANPASWVTLTGLEEQRDSVHPLSFKRFHANAWTGGESPFITAEDWDRNAGHPDIPDGAPVVLGIDASIRHDSTAVCVIRRDGDVIHALWKVWTPVKGGEISLGEVEQHIRGLADRFDVRAAVYDRHYMWHAAQRLDEEGIPMMEWPYVRMASATRTLHEIVTHARLRHGGDQVARVHALAAEVREREHGLIISKRATRAPIDALVALAMAVELADLAEPPRKSVYNQRYELWVEEGLLPPR
jgi:phage terminase large subunit-like protein